MPRKINLLILRRRLFCLARDVPRPPLCRGYILDVTPAIDKLHRQGQGNPLRVSPPFAAQMDGTIVMVGSCFSPDMVPLLAPPGEVEKHRRGYLIFA